MATNRARPLQGSMRSGNRGRPGLLGIHDVLRNINVELKKMELKGSAGMIAGAALIRRDMDQTPPLIPIDTGELRASWFTKLQKKPFVQLVMGFKAKHAIYVHELDWKQGKRPGSGPKFFESSLKRNKLKVLALIAASMKK